ncbi:hypothetical protein C8R44DRAFT_725420 [Mycena epipterygia]|nr:hypothetical protein C8R44DRAFT_725420 [Mycena epipterygia]
MPHPALKLENLGNLPISLRRLAIPAYHGSLENLRRVVTSLTDGSTPQRSQLLPVLYANLDLTAISGPALDLESAPTSDNILRAITSLDGLAAFPEFPDGVLVEFWPRSWQWIQFVYHHRTSLPCARSEKQILANLLLFLRQIFENTGNSFALIHEVPGVRALVARAWALYLGDAHRVDYDPAFTALCMFIRFARSTDDSPNPVDELEEFTDGAGGTSALASLIIRHLTFFSHGGESTVPLLHSAISFLLEYGDQDSPFHRELLAQGILNSVVKALAAVQGATFRKMGNLVACCVVLLGCFLNTFPIYPWIKQAVGAGLIRVFIRCSMRTDAASDSESFIRFVEFLSASTVYRPVLRKLQESVEEARDLLNSGAFPQSVVFDAWREFVELLESRLMLMEKLDRAKESCRKACDNMECGAIRKKTEFRCCSACQSTYYCSEECQRRDWAEGDHREECKRIQCNRFRNAWELGARNKSYIRALLSHDYLARKHEVVSKKRAFMLENPGQEFYVLFDYTAGRIAIKIRPTDRNSRELPPGWFDILSRASRSHGRMELHVALLVVGSSQGFRHCLIPMRSSSSEVDDLDAVGVEIIH